MEGRWRTLPLVGALVVCLALVVAGCGSDSEAVETSDPEATFAPVVQLDPQEEWLPMNTRWFIDRASLWFAEDQGCADRKIAVGKTLKDQRNQVTNWIVPFWLSAGHAYERRTYDASCENRFDPDFSYDYWASQRTRPFDTEDRPEGLAVGEGHYLDLMDYARRGPVAAGESTLDEVPAYVERRQDEVDGESGLRLTYWLFYGMNEPRQGGRVVEPLTHEGDWERADVLLREGDGEDEYEPVALDLYDGDRRRRVPWERVAVTAGPDGRTQPLLLAELGSHTLSAPRRACAECRRWRTRAALADARKRLWFGFGGAWGELGPTSETSGPLGPHGKWPPSQTDITKDPRSEDSPY